VCDPTADFSAEISNSKPVTPLHPPSLLKRLGYRNLKIITFQPSLQYVSVLQAVTVRKMKCFHKKSCTSPFYQNVLKKIDWHACSIDLIFQAIDTSDFVGLEALHFSVLPVFKTRSQRYSKHHCI
jgi:hypothetical protein